MKKRAVILILMLSLVLTMSACQQESAPDPNRTLVLVNDEAIIQSEFDIEYTKSADYIESLGSTITPEMETQLKNDVLQSMIRDLLLKQYAKKDDYEPTAENIENLYQQYVTQHETEDKLKAALEERGFTVEDFRSDLELQLDIDYYLNQYVKDNDLVSMTIVTDKEVEDEFLRYVLETGNETLKLSEVEAQIKSSLGQQKMRTLITKITDQLMTESKIEDKVVFE